MTANELRSSLMRVDRRRYPELDGYTRDEIYGHGDQMSPGALFLAARIARRLEVQPGDVVLDVGCGLGESSIYLARHLGVRVVAVDLGIPPTMLDRKFADRGFRGAILPLNLDATGRLPFAERHFDAVFCMTSIHYFGLTPSAIENLVRHVKPGGRFCVGNTCFDREIPDGHVPNIYRTQPPGSVFDGWESECSKYHSPGWWARLFRDSGLLQVVESVELADGPAMWEDKLAYDLERADWSDDRVGEMSWKIDQILYGREHTPRFTIFAAAAERL